MEKVPRKLVFLVTPLISLLVLPMIFLNLFWVNFPPLHQWKKCTSTSETVEQNQDSLNFLLPKLLKGEDQEKLATTGFACNREVYSIHCVVNHPVLIDTISMTVHISSNSPTHETIVRPYARQEDQGLLETVSPVKIIQGYPDTNATPPACQHNHQIPAVIFSSSGFVGNFFHEMNEILIPLFITTKLFESQVQFILEDYNPTFVRKHEKAMSKLSAYRIMNPALNQSVHCFPGAVIGLKFHGHLSLNFSDIPEGNSMNEFRNFLRDSFGLKFGHASQIKNPTAILLSRRRTRRFLNENEMVSMMEELGFRVIVISRAKSMSNLEIIANYINSCSVLVAAHGAGLTNLLFLPDGAIVVQVDLIGLAWAAATYYGDPFRAMNLHYLRYKIEPEESSISKVFKGRNHTVFRDFKWLSVEAGKEVYLNGQYVRINIQDLGKLWWKLSVLLGTRICKCTLVSLMNS